MESNYRFWSFSSRDEAATPQAGRRTRRATAVDAGGGPLLVCAVLLGLSAMPVVATLAQDSPAFGGLPQEEQRFLDGLISRRLFESAAEYSRKEQDKVKQDPRQAAAWTAQRMKIYSQQALHQPLAQRDGAWSQAAQAASQYLERHTDPLGRLLVRLQRALTFLAQGEFARMEIEITDSSPGAIESTRAPLRQAAGQLEEVHKELTEWVPANRDTPEKRLTTAERDALRRHIEQQLGRAFRNLALTYPANSSDRLAGLNEALRYFTLPLRQLAENSTAAHELRIDQAECQRLLGQFSAAAASLDALEAAELPPAIRLRGRAERIRLLLAANRHAAALELLAQPRSLEGITSPELDFAHLQTYLALWNVAEADQSASWQEKALAAAEFIRQQHGAYWGRRGEVELIRVGGSQQGSNVEILSKTADDLYLKGQWEEALSAYRKAAQTAQEKDQPALSFALGYKAALIETQRENHIAACEQFRRTALALPDDPRAGNAHLMAILAQADAVRDGTGDLQDYAALLDEHLSQWPRSPSAAQAAVWAAQRYEQRGQWRFAAESYWHAAGVPGENLNHASAVQSALRCWLQTLGRETASAAAERQLGDVLSQLERAAPSPSPLANATAAACLTLAFRPERAAETFQLLEKALAAAGPSPAEQTVLARVLLQAWHAQVVGDVTDSWGNEILRDWQEHGDLELVWLLFKTLGNKASPEDRTATARVRLLLAALCQRRAAELDPDRTLELALGHALALSDAGHWQQAVARITPLVTKHPDDGAVQETYARLLAGGENAEARDAALAQWRRVAAGSQPRSPRWFTAKLHIARLLIAQGDRASAKKLIRYLQATEDLAAAGLADQFERLLEH